MVTLGSHRTRAKVREAARLRRVSRNCVAKVRVRLGNVVVPEGNEATATLLLLMSNGAGT